MRFNNKKNKKKAQAKIITTVLLILLVLGSVVLIFNMIKLVLENRERDIDQNFRSFVSDIFEGEEEPDEGPDPLNLANYEDVIFVDNQNINCNDDTRESGLNSETPFCNIQSAVDSGLLPGDIVYVREGTYNEGVLIHVSGQEEDYITIKAYPDEEAIIEPGFSGSEYVWEDLGNGKYSTIVDNLYTPDTIRLIEKDGYGITRVNTLDELDNPDIDPVMQGFGPYNLFYFDGATNELTVKLYSITTDDLYIADSYRRVLIVSPYIEFNGFTVQYGYDGIKPTWTIDYSVFDNHAYYARIINNNIKHIAGQGILSSEEGLLIEGNHMSYFGEPLEYNPQVSGQLKKNNKDHAIYFSGVDGIIKNNSMEKCYNTCMHPWASDRTYPRNTVIEKNIIKEGVSISGTNNIMKNNIIYNFLSIWEDDGLKFYNNLISLDSSQYVRTGYLPNSNLEFKNNIVLGGGGPCMETWLTELGSADFSNNLYFDCNHYGIGEGVNRGVYNNFNDYWSAMQIQGLESGSFYADPMLDSEFKPILNSPAVNEGADLTGIVDFDFEGNPRPFGLGWDIGPYEYDGSGSIPTLSFLGKNFK
ncbi:hypothetical protein GOV12_00160 [Candidatus Pacearchaeota archaeon]|nr:hypothetical protein [Candidatus Pacearchaeota archaeon]